MLLPKLQYISYGNTFEEQYNNILSALDAGIQWIQLRWKNANENEIHQLAEKIKIKCDEYPAVLIINDYPKIAKNTDAHGVHLGLNDLPIPEVKKILNPNQWIGGTANTLNDVLQRINEQVTYIGLGPFRYTSTKKNLSPILGIEGYKKIISSIPSQNIPIYAIGGINENDISHLLSTGIYGVAISSSITFVKDKKSIIQKINQLLYANI